MKWLVYLLFPAFLATACVESESACSDQNPCVSGYACNREGRCVTADDLKIDNDFLPTGHIGKEYHTALGARGGIPPYWNWSLTTTLDWLTVDSESGVLSGIPSSGASSTQVIVSVTDSSYGRGATKSKNLTIDVSYCLETSTEACHFVEGGICYEGSHTCSSGQWSDCANSQPSDDINHCGQSCLPCAAANSDGCLQGVCACGNSAPCTGSDICCEKSCVDLASDERHCGGCRIACAEVVQNATNPRCWDNRCIYDDCLPGWMDCNNDTNDGCETEMQVHQCGKCDRDCAEVVQHADWPFCTPDINGNYFCGFVRCQLGHLDCDGDPTNGCETPVSLNHCGGCGVDCLHGPAPYQNQVCVLDEKAQAYHCGCNGEADCDSARGQQCCDGWCREIDHPNHCGGCGYDCLKDPARPLCLDPPSHLCGCIQDADCGGLSHCCLGSCVPIDQQNCNQCGDVCNIQHGGPVCDASIPYCVCTTDEECNDDYLGNLNRCERVLYFKSCRCGGGMACAGGPGAQCCGNDLDGYACVDVMTDRYNCGRCGVECLGTSNYCVNGVCHCRMVLPNLIDCPQEGPAPDCVNYGATAFPCTCFAFGSGVGGCPGGRSCCSGDQGGAGGPAGGPDQGCCLYPCGQNQPSDCIQQPPG